MKKYTIAAQLTLCLLAIRLGSKLTILKINISHALNMAKLDRSRKQTRALDAEIEQRLSALEQRVRGFR